MRVGVWSYKFKLLNQRKQNKKSYVARPRNGRHVCSVKNGNLEFWWQINICGDIKTWDSWDQITCICQRRSLLGLTWYRFFQLLRPQLALLGFHNQDQTPISVFPRSCWCCKCRDHCPHLQPWASTFSNSPTWRDISLHPSVEMFVSLFQKHLLTMQSLSLYQRPHECKISFSLFWKEYHNTTLELSLLSLQQN